MKFQTIVVNLLLLNSCIQSNTIEEKDSSVLLNDNTVASDHLTYYYLKDTTVKLLWPDYNAHTGNSISINKEYWNTMPDPVKAALSCATSFVQSACTHDPSRLNSSHNMLSALEQNQSKDTFLRQWFRNDTQCLNKLAQGPDYSCTGGSIDEINLTIRGDTIKVCLKIDSATNNYPGSMSRTQEYTFRLEQNNLQLIKENKLKTYYYPL